MLNCPIVPTEPAHIGKKPDSISPQRTLALAATSRSPPEGIRQVLVRGEDVPPRTLVGKVFSIAEYSARVHPFAASPLHPTSACDTLPGAAHTAAAAAAAPEECAAGTRQRTGARRDQSARADTLASAAVGPSAVARRVR